MKEHSVGFLISLFLHLLLTGGLLFFMARFTLPVRTLSLDFSLLKGGEERTARDRTVRAGSKGRPGEQRTAEKDTSGGLENDKTGRQEEQPVRQPAQAKNHVAERAGLQSDPDSEVSVRTTVRTGGNAGQVPAGASQVTGTAGLPSSAVKGTGGSKSLNYGVTGKDEVAHAYIREAIMKHVTYPERARRMGWEGKVILSFIVFEDGTIHEVRIVNSSGFKSLDENAKEAVVKTGPVHKMPFRLIVHLPVDYRLE